MKDLPGPSHKSRNFSLSQSIGSLRCQPVTDASVDTPMQSGLAMLSLGSVVERVLMGLRVS